MKTCLLGIAILLFAILFQLSSTGLEPFTLGMGLLGLIITISGRASTDNK